MLKNCFLVLIISGLTFSCGSEKPKEVPTQTDKSEEVLPQSSLSAPEEKEGEWTKLLPETGFEGWTKRGGKAKYENENGVLTGISHIGAANTFLCTEKIYADFELRLDVKIDTAINSGIQIRSNSLPDYKSGRVHGYQVEIDPSDRAWSGGIYDESRRGWLVNLQENEAGQKAFDRFGWNRYRILARKDSIFTWVNDVPTAVLRDTVTASGFVALQVHATDKEKPSKVQWRNIRIREILE